MREMACLVSLFDSVRSTKSSFVCLFHHLFNLLRMNVQTDKVCIVENVLCVQSNELDIVEVEHVVTLKYGFLTVRININCYLRNCLNRRDTIKVNAKSRHRHLNGEMLFGECICYLISDTRH